MSDLKGEIPQQPEEAPEVPQDQAEKTTDRRGFLGLMGNMAIGAMAAMGTYVGARASDQFAQPTPTDKELAQQYAKTPTATAIATTVLAAATATPTAQPTQQPTQQPASKPSATEVVVSPPEPRETSEIELLNTIVEHPLNTPEREQAEQAVMNRLFEKSAQQELTKKDIDQALWVVADHQKRQGLLSLRHQLRIQQKDLSLNPLSAEQQNWAKQHKISPETLGIALDAYPRAKKIIEALLKADAASFRPDIAYLIGQKKLPEDTLEKLTAEQIMITLGGLSKLIVTETGGVTYEGSSSEQRVQEGFTTIGNRPAYDETNPAVFPNGFRSLKDLADLLKGHTGINFQDKNIPGSARGDTEINASGGAVGVQMMPDNVLEILKLIQSSDVELDQQDRWLNIFDPEDAAIMAWIFIARGVKVGTQGYRFGYYQNWDLNPKSIEKWNPFPPQRDAIMKANNDYSKQFLG